MPGTNPSGYRSNVGGVSLLSRQVWRWEQTASSARRFVEQWKKNVSNSKSISETLLKIVMVSTYLQCFIVIKQKMVLGNLKYNEKFGCNITCWNLLHKNTWASNCKCGGIQRSAAKNHTILHQNTINLHEWPNNSCRVKYELLRWMFMSKEQRKSVVKVESGRRKFWWVF